VEMGCHDAIFCAVPGHAHQFLSAEVGRQEGEAGDPNGHRAAGGQKVPAGGDLTPKPPADTEDEAEIDGEYQVINYGEFQRWTSAFPRILQKGNLSLSHANAGVRSWRISDGAVVWCH